MMNKIYAGIGARALPESVADFFIHLGRELANDGWTLRSGAADGADAAFEKGCDISGGVKEIYLPWKEFNGHPSHLFEQTRSFAKRSP